MIRYTLKCANDHGFEAWYASAEAYNGLQKAGHVTCPDCGSGDVEKAIMAPQVRPSRGRAAPPQEKEGQGPLSAPASDREKALAELRAQVEANSDYVGMNFAAEARAMHDGETPLRSIHGEARLDEAKSLIEDGVPVAPLPFRSRSRSN